MEMTVKDRLYLPALLPDKGTYKEFNIKQGILQKVAITDAEREELGLHRIEETGRIEWNTDKETPLAVEFSREELELLKSSCERLSDQTLPDDMWGTVERIFLVCQEL